MKITQSNQYFDKEEIRAAMGVVLSSFVSIHVFHLCDGLSLTSVEEKKGHLGLSQMVLCSDAYE